MDKLKKLLEQLNEMEVFDKLVWDDIGDTVADFENTDTVEKEQSLELKLLLQDIATEAEKL